MKWSDEWSDGSNLYRTIREYIDRLRPAAKPVKPRIARMPLNWPIYEHGRVPIIDSYRGRLTDGFIIRHTFGQMHTGVAIVTWRN